MESLSKKIFTLLICFLSNTSVLFGQSFEKSILVEISGDNYDIDLLSNEFYSSNESFITWINKNDSIYTVYLKKISPEISDTNVVISSSSCLKSNPKVVLNRYNKGIKIIWQNYLNNHFQIVGCNYLNDTLSCETILEDSLVSDPSISLSTHRLAYIDNRKLFIKEFYPTLSAPILVDSLNCTSPDILRIDDLTYTQILYERIDNGNNLICLAELNNSQVKKIDISIIANGNNKNANFGMVGSASFETIENGFSKIKYTNYVASEYFKTTNTNCNFKNPNVFSYEVPTGSTNLDTPFFVAFDTDSLENNNEIFIKTFYYGSRDSLFNISKMEGNDYKPKVAFLENEGTAFAAIIWLNRNNFKTNIWLAKTIYNPIYSNVKNESVINSFDLYQNYPNPFNPTTNIEYFIEQGSDVDIKVFDVLGNHILTLVNGYKKAGKHKEIFNAEHLSSGVYFYSINANGKQKTKSMVLLR